MNPLKTDRTLSVGDSDPHPTPGIPFWLWGVWGISLLLTIGLAIDFSPWLRGDLDWRWVYYPVFIPAGVVRVSLGLALYICLAISLWAWLGRRPESWRVWGIVGFAVLASLFIQVGVQTISSADPWSNLMLRSTVPGMSGYHTVAVTVKDIPDFLRQFPEQVLNYPKHLSHPQRHPPGLILYFIGWERLFRAFPTLGTEVANIFHRYRCEWAPMLYLNDAQYAAAIGGFLPLLLTALMLIPFYAAGRHFVGEQRALAATLLSPLVPGYALWAGIWDQALLVVVTLLLWLLSIALIHKRPWAWWAAGGLLSIASFFNYSALILLGFFVFYACLHLWLERASWQPHGGLLLLNGLGFCVMLGSAWFLYGLISGVSFLTLYRANTAPHYDMPTHYLARLFYNPYDFFLFLGYPLGLLLLFSIGQIRSARMTGLRPAQRLVAAFAVTLGLLTLSGISRAEVGRVWLLLMPLAVLSACAAQGGPAHSLTRWGITAVLLSAQMVVMQAVLDLTNRQAVEINGHITYTYELPSQATPLQIRLGDSLDLAGFQLDKDHLRPNEVLDLTLYWRALQPQTASYTIFRHLYNEQLGWAAQFDDLPLEGRYPTSCWQPGEIVADRASIPISPQAVPGRYNLSVGLYDLAADNQRLPISGLDTEAGAILLSQIQIEP